VFLAGFFAPHKLPPIIAQRPRTAAIFLTLVFIFSCPATLSDKKLSHKPIEV
jgi:hypothetical protein